MRAVRTLPVGELPTRPRAAPPPGGESIAAAVEAFLAVDAAAASPKRANDSSGTYALALEEASVHEATDEDADESAPGEEVPVDEARDQRVVDAVLAMLGPTPIAQLLRAPSEALRGGSGGEDGARRALDQARTSTGSIDLRELGLFSEGAPVRGLPSFYPTVRPNAPLQSLAEVAVLEPTVAAPSSEGIAAPSSEGKALSSRDAKGPLGAFRDVPIAGSRTLPPDTLAPNANPEVAGSEVALSAPRTTLPAPALGARPDAAAATVINTTLNTVAVNTVNTVNTFITVNTVSTTHSLAANTVHAVEGSARGSSLDASIGERRDERSEERRETRGGPTVETAAPLETAHAVSEVETVGMIEARTDATHRPTEHASRSLAPEPPPYDDSYASLFPERSPLSTRSFLEGSLLPGADTASTRLELQHPTLGALTLHLAQYGDGVDVDFSAPSLDAAIALRASEEGLRAELKENGTELGGFRVRTRRSAPTDATEREGGAVSSEAWQPSGRHDRRRI